MNKNVVETIIGALVLLVASYFMYYAYTSTQYVNNSDATYTIYGKFDRVDGVSLGGDVRVSGVKIGKITSLKLDEKTFQAVLGLSIAQNIKLPLDTSAEIIGNGLLGEKYVALVPGSDDAHIEQNGYLDFTQSSISIEGLIGKFMFGVDKKDGAKDVSATNK